MKKLIKYWPTFLVVSGFIAGASLTLDYGTGIAFIVLLLALTIWAYWILPQLQVRIIKK